MEEHPRTMEHAKSIPKTNRKMALDTPFCLNSSMCSTCLK